MLLLLKEIVSNSVKADKNGKSKKMTKKSVAVVPVPTPSIVTNKPITAPQKNQQNISPEEQKKIQEMIALAQLEFQKIKTNVVKEKKREIETLDTLIKEFVGPFMLIGYDLSNNPIEMVSATSPAEHDALLERLRRVMFKINQNIANSGGNDPYGFNSN